MQAIFFDTHAHLDYPDFAQELRQAIERAQKVGITKIVTIGTDLESSRRAVQLSEQFRDVFAVVGWHPSYAMNAPADLRPALRELAIKPKVVALGETGLDYHRLPSKSKKRESENSGEDIPQSEDVLAHQDECYKVKQAALFAQHLEIASELGLNCVVHQRDAFEDTLNQLRPYSSGVRGVFHCFANDEQSMKRVLELGSLVSFTGILTFKNGQNIRDTLAATPMNHFMLETDSPYLAPVPYRGKRCEPAYVKEIAEVAASVKGCSMEELSKATCATAEEFFRGLS
jgi:TatD DNase family protein